MTTSLRTLAALLGLATLFGVSTAAFSQPQLTRPGFAPYGRQELIHAARDLERATHRLADEIAHGRYCHESQAGIEHLEDLVGDFRVAVIRGTSHFRLQSSLKHIVVDFRELIGHLRQDGVSHTLQREILLVRDRLNAVARFAGTSLQFGHDCDFGHDHHDHGVGYDWGFDPRSGGITVPGRGSEGPVFNGRGPRLTEPVFVPQQPMIVPPPRNSLGLKLGKVQIQFQSR